MASHHPHPHSHHHQNHPPTATCCCTTSYSSCHCTQSPHPHYSPQPQPHSDPLLLQALASHLLQSNPPPHSDPYLPKPHKSHHQPKPHSHIQQQQQLHTLVSRIEALEASLHHYSSSSRNSRSHSSLRDYASRVIQTHFRSFLVRRSRTLRQLKDLAFIKSSFASLKSSISNRTHFDFHSVSQKALALLLRLESIQCGDPIVRDGKRSMSRELVKFLDFIEGLVVKKQGVLLKQVKKNVRPVHNVTKSNRVVVNKCEGGGLGRDQREMIGKLRDRIEKIRGFARVSENDEEDVELEGFQHVSDDEEEEDKRVGQCTNEAVVKRSEFQPKVKKTVSFAENDVFRVFGSGEDDEQGSSGDGSDSSGDHGERVENCSEVEDVKGFALEAKDDDEVLEENGGSAKTSYAERKPRARMSQRRDHGQGDNEYLLFSPPLPVKMDSKDATIVVPSSRTISTSHTRQSLF